MTGQNTQTKSATKGYKGMAMEGMIARWYAQNTRHRGDFKTLAARFAAALAPGSRVLEVAPGPGYLSIALAQRGTFQITGLDISKTFVEIASANARTAGVDIEFRQGNASDMPLPNDTFDFIVCCAAFKNFTEPVRAIREMYRVLKPGGSALIIDLRRDASPQGIDDEIRSMRMNTINAFMTRQTFNLMLLKNAYTRDEIRNMVAQTAFRTCEIATDAIGMEISLVKPS